MLTPVWLLSVLPTHERIDTLGRSGCTFWGRCLHLVIMPCCLMRRVPFSSESNHLQRPWPHQPVLHAGCWWAEEQLASILGGCPQGPLPRRAHLERVHSARAEGLTGARGRRAQGGTHTGSQGGVHALPTAVSVVPLDGSNNPVAHLALTITGQELIDATAAVLHN
jgi:hypothetical protein